jgi:hypothetical protein
MESLNSFPTLWGKVRMGVKTVNIFSSFQEEAGGGLIGKWLE